MDDAKWKTTRRFFTIQTEIIQVSHIVIIIMPYIFYSGHHIFCEGCHNYLAVVKSKDLQEFSGEDDLVLKGEEV